MAAVHTIPKPRMRRVLVCLMAVILSFTVLSMAASAVVFGVIFSREDRPSGPAELRYSDVDPEKYPRRSIKFLSGDNTLQGYVYPAPSPRGLVVVAGGIRSDADRHLPEIEYFVDHGWSALAFSGTGVHDSQGGGLRGLPQTKLDLLSALEYVRSDPALLDLPVVIREASEQIPALIPTERRELVHYHEVDATNYASLERALQDIEGGVCITTEGLLMYFTDSEAGALCDNIRRILEKKGGCWYTADAEASLQYVITMRALVGDRFMEIMKNATRQTSDKSDVQVGKNALITKPADMPGTTRNAMAFLAKHGLKAERVTVAEHMPELTSLSRVSPQQAAAVREGMKHCAFWKITPSAAAPVMELPSSEAEGFGIHASINGGTLSLALSGRLDTITAPNLLAFFEKAQAEQPAKTVAVDCGRLDYISSAGLRVLLIMHKACEDGVTLRGVNEVVTEILGQTGFDSILNIEN